MKANPIMSFAVAFVAWLLLSASSARCQIPSFTRAFFPIQDENLARACQSALLLTPEQTAALQTDWQSCWREILLLRKANSAAKNQEIIQVKARFDQKRDAILTSEQRDIMLSICEIFTSVYKVVSMDFQARIDAAFSETEKNALIGERNKTFNDASVNEIEKSLSGERLAMFQASMNKK